MTSWHIESAGLTFERFLRKLPPYEQAVVFAAIDHVLAKDGIDICHGEWGKALGRGLYEFRIRHSQAAILRRAGMSAGQLGANQPVLLRVFCTFYGERVAVLLHGYNKARDPSTKRQRREIAKARVVLAEWSRAHRTGGWT